MSVSQKSSYPEMIIGIGFALLFPFTLVSEDPEAIQGVAQIASHVEAFIQGPQAEPNTPAPSMYPTPEYTEPSLSQEPITLDPEPVIPESE